MKTKKAFMWLMVAGALALTVGLLACSPSTESDEGTEAVLEAVSDEFVAENADEYGVVHADAYAEVYPNEYATYLENEANSPDSGKHNYLELYPALNTMYKGYAFALGYDEASSHLYTLESVSSSPRTIKKEQLANCISCKTPQFTALVHSEGETVYTEKFNDLIATFDEPISCWNCHENDPTTLTVGNTFFTDALGSDVDKVDLSAQVCGQCHNEYYFNSETKATTNPYVGLNAMTPEAILAYYDEMGFKDWSHADTMAPMIKVQHPEFETVYGGDQSHMAKLGYTCADCHMGTTADDSGSEYTSHLWQSPLANDELLTTSCNISGCHTDLAAQVAEWQAAEEERVQAISLKIEEFTNKIAEKYADEIAELKAAADAGESWEASEELAALQKLQRNAQFYWDFVMVENSEGAHNVELTNATLDLAEQAVDEGLAKLA